MILREYASKMDRFRLGLEYARLELLRCAFSMRGEISRKSIFLYEFEIQCSIYAFRLYRQEEHNGKVFFLEFEHPTHSKIPF